MRRRKGFWREGRTASKVEGSEIVVIFLLHNETKNEKKKKKLSFIFSSSTHNTHRHRQDDEGSRRDDQQEPAFGVVCDRTLPARGLQQCRRMQGQAREEKVAAVTNTNETDQGRTQGRDSQSSCWSQGKIILSLHTHSLSLFFISQSSFSHPLSL